MKTKCACRHPELSPLSALWRDPPFRALPFTLCSLHRLRAGWRGPRAGYTSDAANSHAMCKGSCKCYMEGGKQNQPTPKSQGRRPAQSLQPWPPGSQPCVHHSFISGYNSSFHSGLKAPHEVVLTEFHNFFSLSSSSDLNHCCLPAKGSP